MPTDVQNSVLQRLSAQKEANTIVSWDPHVDYLQDAAFNSMAFDMLQYVDLFLPSQEEVFAMYGSRDLESAARDFANAGPGIVAIKKSIEGSLLYIRDEGKFYNIPIYPSETVDPTGAGDSYCGGFLAGYLKTNDPVHAARCGTVSASFVVEHVGALNTFRSDFSQIEKRMNYLENYKS
jgi:ribokinase